jgi:type VI protein secretion system component VasF
MTLEIDSRRVAAVADNSLNAATAGRSRGAQLPNTARLATVLGLGLGVGIATSLLQATLDGYWSSLVNAASPWLVAAFVAGALWRLARSAALVGLAASLLELVGYYVTAMARGYSASHAELMFWAVCAVLGGPVLGLGGWLWWRSSSRLRGLGAALLVAAFISEAAISYGWRLHYRSSALLFAAIGVVTYILLGFHHRQHRRIALWLLATLPAGIVAEMLLGLVYNQSFG